MINQIDKVDEWHMQRRGKFTASEIYKLLVLSADGMFSPGGLTYIKLKAIEEMTEYYDRPEMEYVEPLIHGKQQEANAYSEYLSVTKNYSMRHFGDSKPLFLDYNDYSGGSPDGIMGEGEKVIWGLELKSPYQPSNHAKYLEYKDQWDLKLGRKEYYAQIQFLLMITKAEGWHFCSFDERWKNKKNRLKVIEIKLDKKFQDNLHMKLISANEEKKKIIQLYNN